MHTEKYIIVLVISVILLSINSKVLAAGDQGTDLVSTSTQGQFAVRLAESLGHPGLKEKEAISLLSSLSIRPGIIPVQSQWQADQVATPQFVAHIQAAIQLMLKKVAEQSKISPPPTLDLMIFEVPPAPQRVFFPIAEAIEGTPPLPVSMPPSNEITQNLPIEANMIGGGMASLEVEGVASENASNLKEFIDKAIIEQLEKHDKVAVIVELKPTLSARPEVAIEDVIAKEQKSVLDTLSADEFKLKHRYSSLYTFSGWISKKGIKKLEKNPSVLRISLDSISSIQK